MATCRATYEAFDGAPFKLVKGSMKSDYYSLRQFKCRECGSKKFNVAQTEFHTEIRCVKCKVQDSIHDG